ncbi:MAG: metallophosphoesterase family protein [Candidatus Babeliales bacterium]
MRKIKKLFILSFFTIIFLNLNARWTSLRQAIEAIDRLPASTTENLSYKKANGVSLEDLSKQIDEFLFCSFNKYTLFDGYKVEKVKIPEDSSICFIGDLHGCADSLSNILKQLIRLNYLDINSFETRNNNFNLVFLGDYTNRNCYGLETLSLILELAIANPERVFILHGNHEEIHMLTSNGAYHGFKEELERKFLLSYDPLNSAINKILYFYNSLPVAVFIGVDVGEQYLMCSHGGFDLNFDFDSFLDKKNRWKFSELQSGGQYFMWTDFYQRIAQNNYGILREVERIQTISADFMRYNFFGALENNMCNYKITDKVKAIFRGHQHELYGLKMLFEPSIFYQNYLNSPDFPDSGIWHWRQVVKHEDQENMEGFRIGDYLPIFTLSSASSCPVYIDNKYDCFAILTINRFIRNSRLQVYETLHESRNIEQKNREQIDKIEPEQFDVDEGKEYFKEKEEGTKCCPRCIIL